MPSIIRTAVAAWTAAAVTAAKATPQNKTCDQSSGLSDITPQGEDLLITGERASNASVFSFTVTNPYKQPDVVLMTEDPYQAVADSVSVEMKAVLSDATVNDFLEGHRLPGKRGISNLGSLKALVGAWESTGGPVQKRWESLQRDIAAYRGSRKLNPTMEIKPRDGMPAQRLGYNHPKLDLEAVESLLEIWKTVFSSPLFPKREGLWYRCATQSDIDPDRMSSFALGKLSANYCDENNAHVVVFEGELANLGLQNKKPLEHFYERDPKLRFRRQTREEHEGVLVGFAPKKVATLTQCKAEPMITVTSKTDIIYNNANVPKGQPPRNNLCQLDVLVDYSCAEGNTSLPVSMGTSARDCSRFQEGDQVASQGFPIQSISTYRTQPSWLELIIRNTLILS